MKNIIKKIEILFSLIKYSYKTRTIIPIEEAKKYMDSKKAFPKGSYLKDVNHVLDKFVGTWKGTYEDKSYEFKITKFTDIRENLKEDILLMRYLITKSNGTVIEDTRSLPNASPYVINGYYLEKETYSLIYIGKNTGCGQSGIIFINLLKDYNNSKITLFLEPDSIIFDKTNCFNRKAKQIMPIVGEVTLLKQKK